MRSCEPFVTRISAPVASCTAGVTLPAGERCGMDAVDRFLASPSLSDATRRAYRSDLNAFSRWLSRRGVRLEQVDTRILSEYVDELGRERLAPGTIARRVSTVRSLIKHALGSSRVPELPLSPRKPRRLPDAPKLEEVEALV